MSVIPKAFTTEQEGVKGESFTVDHSDAISGETPTHEDGQAYIEDMATRYGVLAVALMADKSFTQKVRQDYAKARGLGTDNRVSADDAAATMGAETYMVKYERKKADLAKKASDTLDQMKPLAAYNFFVARGFSPEESAAASGYDPS